MEIPFARRSARYAITFQVIFEGFYPTEASALSKLEFCIFAKAGRIRIEERASTAKRFENKLGGRNLVGELGPLLAGIADTQLEKGLDGKPTVLRLSAPCLATVQDRVK